MTHNPILLISRADCRDSFNPWPVGDLPEFGFPKLAYHEVVNLLVTPGSLTGVWTCFRAYSVGPYSRSMSASRWIHVPGSHGRMTVT